MSEYLVEVKQSARKSNAAVGSLVCQRGVSHRFDSREAAESWAADLADDDAHVWVRAANPDDRSDVDAYLVGWLHRTDPPLAVPTSDVEETDDASGLRGEQAWLADYGRVEQTADPEDETARRRGGERITDWLVSE